jgi:hypothetical protein
VEEVAGAVGEAVVPDAEPLGAPGAVVEGVGLALPLVADDGAVPVVEAPLEVLGVAVVLPPGCDEGCVVVGAGCWGEGCAAGAGCEGAGADEGEDEVLPPCDDVCESAEPATSATAAVAHTMVNRIRPPLRSSPDKVVTSGPGDSIGGRFHSRAASGRTATWHPARRNPNRGCESCACSGAFETAVGRFSAERRSPH